MTQSEDPSNTNESIDITNEEEIEEIPISSSLAKDSWNDLSYMPNKTRFLILAILVSVLELGGLFIFAYAIKVDGNDFKELGLFLLPPFFGALIAYFVENKKEAVGVSAINALTSVLIFTIISLPLDKFVINPDMVISPFDYLIPVMAIILQVIIAYTIARMRAIYRAYGDSTHPLESDKAMIAELEAKRQQEENSKEKVTEESEK